MSDEKELFEIVAEVIMHVEADDTTDAEETALRILNDVAVDSNIISIV